ncbi:dihydroorotase [Paracraurococcus ruber]|uniref:Allantoinase n=1 Tax=Paracraurococcus ruber TaxID=77675 RepID=A0ABS1D4T0_9PROT|nr:amidohydrolase family protein [Paracraurococcus ruber]MBK1661082.1 allantoinase [Paracraurococcus ruber]TDG23882.1 allantoinase [Paracraurococcus ruber]
MTAQPFDRIVLGDLVLPDAVLPDGWVAVRGEVFAGIGQGAPPPAAEVADHRGMLVLPGLVDGHMHTSSSTGWPGIEGASMSAAAGGVTTCVDMPYDVPRPVTDAAILREKIGWVNRTSHVDMALYGTITKAGGIDAIAGLAEAGACSFKLSTYEYDAVRFPRIDHPTMLAAFRAIARTGLMCAIHNEDQELVERLTAEAKAAGRTDPIMHARTRPPLAESMADLEIFEMARETGCHVHIAHSSIARGFHLAEAFRRLDGARTSAEACIQYLCMTEEDLVRLQGFGKCNPPFRTAEEVERVWAALLAGQVAYVSTDHAPWPRARKEYHGDIFAPGAGLTGLQSFAPLMYSLLAERGLPPTLMARYCAEQPARFHGLAPRKGAIRLGGDADLCVLERGDFTFDAREIRDREDARWSPYDGRAMRARVAATYLRGRCIWDGAAVLAAPGTGRFVPRQHAGPVPESGAPGQPAGR